ncbi:unnamed protein product [Blepharisma stoltei]|uniref:Transposase n=1 Tax=Blepharisma stoltei TaxID=1481888 RepID=A0AAU9JI93_9CILI|nr:unnamed protein product [Blepharisma stoltei]
MRPRDIGMCALFRGVNSVSKLMNRDPEEVEAYVSLVSYESAPCFAKLRQTLQEVVSDIGLKQCSEMLQMPEKVLSMIILEDEEAPKSKTRESSPPSPPSYRSKEKSRNPEENKKPSSKEQPSIRIASQNSQENHKSTEEEYKELGEYNCINDLKARVIRLYANGVRTRVIQNLYDIRNLNIIHSWGLWERSEPDVAEKCRKIKERALILKQEGKTEAEIATELNIKVYKLNEVLGVLPSRIKLIFTAKDIKQALDFYRVLKNKDKTAKKLGISVSTLDEWIYKNEKGRIKTVFDDKDGVDPLTILNSLETYFLTKSVDKAAKVGNVDVLKVSKWVKQFEAKMNEEGRKTQKDEEMEEEIKKKLKKAE